MATRKPKAKRSHLREWPKPRPKSLRPDPNALPMRTRGGTGGNEAKGVPKGGEGGNGAQQGPMERAREWLKLDDPLGRPVQITLSATLLNAALLAIAVLMAVVMSSCLDRVLPRAGAQLGGSEGGHGAPTGAPMEHHP